MADSIFYGGDIVSVSGDPSSWDLGAVAVKNGVVTAVCQTLDEAAILRVASTRLIDLQGATLLPGLIEPHSHPVSSAIIHNKYVNITGMTPPLTKEEVWLKIKTAIQNTPEGGTIQAAFLNPLLVPGIEFPSLGYMDELAPNHSLVLVAQGGHTIACNSRALERAGVTASTPDPDGGSYGRDAEGNLTGVCHEGSTIIPILEKLEQASEAITDGYLKKQLDSYAKNGYTTVAALGVIKLIPDAVKKLRNVVATEGSPTRIVTYINGEKFEAGDDVGRDFAEGANYKMIGIKFWADGSPYSGTIAMDEPFLDTSVTRSLGFKPYPNKGVLNYADDELFRKLLPFHSKGFQLAVHAHGDRTIRHVLDVYERLLTEHPRPDHRHRLEHCGLITKQQMARAKKMGVSLSFYPDHIYFFGSSLRDGILGPERAGRFMPLKSALDAGHEFTLHSDTPCTPLGVMRNFKTAVTRRMRAAPGGNTSPSPQEESLGPQECIPVDEVIKCYTINAARQIFHEKCLGSIEVGKIADFTVLSQNPRKVNPNDLDKIAVLETYRSGTRAKLFEA